MKQTETERKTRLDWQALVVPCQHANGGFCDRAAYAELPDGIQPRTRDGKPHLETDDGRRFVVAYPRWCERCHRRCPWDRDVFVSTLKRYLEEA